MHPPTLRLSPCLRLSFCTQGLLAQRLPCRPWFSHHPGFPCPGLHPAPVLGPPSLGPPWPLGSTAHPHAGPPSTSLSMLMVPPSCPLISWAVASEVLVEPAPWPGSSGFRGVTPTGAAAGLLWIPFPASEMLALLSTEQWPLSVREALLPLCL